MLVLLLSQSRIESDLPSQNEVCVLLQTEVSINLHHYASLFEVLSRHWLAFVENVVFVLTVETSEVSLELNVEVFLH